MSTGWVAVSAEGDDPDRPRPGRKVGGAAKTAKPAPRGHPRATPSRGRRTASGGESDGPSSSSDNDDEEEEEEDGEGDQPRGRGGAGQKGDGQKGAAAAGDSASTELSDDEDAADEAAAGAQRLPRIPVHLACREGSVPLWCECCGPCLHACHA